jgi:hypothetical protein
MQTFLPYPDFAASAATLDRQRLGKQRVEAWQILRTLLGQTSGWTNHPAVKMWRGHETALALYGEAVCREWRSRGYEDTLLAYFVKQVNEGLSYRPPPWFGDEAFHHSHRANLVRKMPAHYVPLFGEMAPEDYVWPTNHVESL